MAFSKRSFVGKGKLYLCRFGQNNLQRIGNSSKLSLSIDQESKELADYENPGGGIADAITRIKEAKVSLTLHNLNAANLAIAVFGDASAISGRRGPLAVLPGQGAAPQYDGDADDGDDDLGTGLHGRSPLRTKSIYAA